MVHDRIRILLEDAFLSSLLVHSAGVLGESVGAPMKLLDATIPMGVVKRIYRFRQELLGADQEWIRPYTSATDIHNAYVKEDFRDYSRASALEIPADMFSWVRSGKRVWFVESGTNETGNSSAPDIFALDCCLPSSSTMVWLDEPVTTTYNNKRVSCNLALYTKVGEDWHVRFFCNPQEDLGRPMVPIGHQQQLASWVLAKSSNKTKGLLLGGKRMDVPMNKANAFKAIDLTSKKLVELYEPGGMAGSLLGVVRLSTPELMLTAHMSDLTTKVIERTIAWAKNLGQQREKVPVSSDTDADGVTDRRKAKQLPKMQTVFAPEEVFLIRHTRQISSASSGSSGSGHGTGRMVTVEHTRRGHWRTLNRGTDRERQVWVNQAHVIPKEGPTELPKGVLIKPGK